MPGWPEVPKGIGAGVSTALPPRPAPQKENRILVLAESCSRCTKICLCRARRTLANDGRVPNRHSRALTASRAAHPQSRQGAHQLIPSTTPTTGTTDLLLQLQRLCPPLRIRACSIHCMGACSSFYTSNNTHCHQHEHPHARSRHAAGERDTALTAGSAGPPGRPRRAATLPGTMGRHSR